MTVHDLFTTTLFIPTSVDFPGALPILQYHYQPIQERKKVTANKKLGELHLASLAAQNFLVHSIFAKGTLT